MPDPTDSPATKVSRAARALTKDQLAELLAITRAELTRRWLGTRPSISVLHRDGDVYGPLIAAGVIEWLVRNKRLGWGRLTVFGRRVMLRRIEDDLRAGGFLPDEEGVEDDA